MATISSIAAFLEEFAPPRLAAEWDNVGLLLGDRRAPVQRLMTCLTITPTSAAEAIAENANLIVTHHPFPFHPRNRITADDATGKIILDLVAAKIAIYSPHTAFDSARSGINQRFAEGVGLSDVGPLVRDTIDPALGTGRFGFPSTATTLAGMAARVKDFLNLPGVHVVGNLQMRVRSVAVACGSGAELLDIARKVGCDCFITGEARFHTCLEAEASNMGLILASHYASERFAVERLAELLASQFPDVTTWASRHERDPMHWL